MWNPLVFLCKIRSTHTFAQGRITVAAESVALLWVDLVESFVRRQHRYPGCFQAKLFGENLKPVLPARVLIMVVMRVWAWMETDFSVISDGDSWNMGTTLMKMRCSLYTYKKCMYSPPRHAQLSLCVCNFLSVAGMLRFSVSPVALVFWENFSYKDKKRGLESLFSGWMSTFLIEVMHFGKISVGQKTKIFFFFFLVHKKLEANWAQNLLWSIPVSSRSQVYCKWLLVAKQQYWLHWLVWHEFTSNRWLGERSLCVFTVTFVLLCKIVFRLLLEELGSFHHFLWEGSEEMLQCFTMWKCWYNYFFFLKFPILVDTIHPLYPHRAQQPWPYRIFHLLVLNHFLVTKVRTYN